MARKSSPVKYPCAKCGSTNLRFRVDGQTYQCFACGHHGKKKTECAKK